MGVLTLGQYLLSKNKVKHKLAAFWQIHENNFECAGDFIY